MNQNYLGRCSPNAQYRFGEASSGEHSGNKGFLLRCGALLRSLRPRYLSRFASSAALFPGGILKTFDQTRLSGKSSHLCILLARPDAFTAMRRWAARAASRGTALTGMLRLVPWQPVPAARFPADATSVWTTLERPTSNVAWRTLTFYSILCNGIAGASSPRPVS